MKRIQIVGTSGSGKTTLGKQLSEKLSIPHYELDLQFWLPEWKQKPKDQYMKDLGELLQEESYILCGDYINTSEGITLRNLDTVIWLNYPSRIFLWRMIKRTVRRTITREKLWGHSRENMVLFLFHPKKSLFWQTLHLHYSKGRRRYDNTFKQYNYGGSIVEFRSPKETEAWLQTL